MMALYMWGNEREYAYSLAELEAFAVINELHYKPFVQWLSG